MTARASAVHAQDDENSWANPPASVDVTVAQHVDSLAKCLLPQDFLRGSEAMIEESAIDAAVKRLALALDALDAAAERRKQADRNEEGLAAQVQALGLDRTRLAAALDGETARSRRLESTNREIAERLDSAIASIQSVLDLHE